MPVPVNYPVADLMGPKTTFDKMNGMKAALHPLKAQIDLTLKMHQLCSVVGSSLIYFLPSRHSTLVFNADC